jgi:addiction module HigA family antidote
MVLAFLEDIGRSQADAARAVGIKATRLNEVVKNKRGISADTALRLAKRFGNPARFWMELQADFDLEAARKVLTA